MEVGLKPSGPGAVTLLLGSFGRCSVVSRPDFIVGLFNGGSGSLKLGVGFKIVFFSSCVVALVWGPAEEELGWGGFTSLEPFRAPSFFASLIGNTRSGEDFRWESLIGVLLSTSVASFVDESVHSDSELASECGASVVALFFVGFSDNACTMRFIFPGLYSNLY